MFAVIEAVVGVILVTACAIIWKRLKPSTTKARTLVALGLLSIVLFASVAFTYIKDARTFQTAEDAFQSEAHGTIEFVTEGKDSCAVYYHERENAWTALYLRHDGKGYHTVSSPAIRFVQSGVIFSGAKGTYSLVQVRGTQDCYVEVSIALEEGEPGKVYDMQGDPVPVIPIYSTDFFVLFVADPSQPCRFRIDDRVVTLWE